MPDIRANIPHASGPLDNIADAGDVFKSPLQAEYIRQLVRLLKFAFAKAVLRDQAVPHIHLVTAGGKVYRLKVTDAGAVVADYVRG